MHSLCRITNDIRRKIDDLLNACGLFYRLFSREKSFESMQKKIEAKGYGVSGELLQDSIGVRVVFYFRDDVPLFVEALKHAFELMPGGMAINDLGVDKFSAEKINLVFRLSDEYRAEFLAIIKELPVDQTFEVQIRTILSEGWQEVDHDLRYKRKPVWEDNSDLSRVLNGIMGNLEGCDWSILQVCSELSYRCYQKKNWNDMVRTKFRLRLSDSELSGGLIEYMDSNPDFAKSLFRVDRGKVVRAMLTSGVDFPKTISNFVYFVNFIELKSSALIDMTLPALLNSWKNNDSLVGL